jgi:hypothetical protein
MAYNSQQELIISIFFILEIFVQENIHISVTDAIQGICEQKHSGTVEVGHHFPVSDISFENKAIQKRTLIFFLFYFLYLEIFSKINASTFFIQLIKQI